MKLMPVRKKMVQSIDEVYVYMGNSILCAIFGFISILLFMWNIEKFYICFVIAGFVALFYAFCFIKVMLATQENITDITNNFIELDENSIVCFQTAGDSYETCCIYFEEILSVTEMTGKNCCGIYIQIKEGANERASTLQVNNVITEVNIFELRGGLYDTEKFIDMYYKLVEYLPEEVTIEKRTSHKNWWSRTKRQKIFFFLTPWIVSVILYTLQFLIVNSVITEICR